MVGRKEMIDALAATVIPALRNAGFTGSLPHLRRKRSQFYDLIIFQFDRHGGGFVIELARCLPTGIDRPEGHVAAVNARAWDRHPNYRKRIQAKPGPGLDAWFRYDCDPPAVVANAVLNALKDLDIWSDLSPLGSEAPYHQ